MKVAEAYNHARKDLKLELTQGVFAKIEPDGKCYVCGVTALLAGAGCSVERIDAAGTADSFLEDQEWGSYRFPHIAELLREYGFKGNDYDVGLFIEWFDDGGFAEDDEFIVEELERHFENN